MANVLHALAVVQVDKDNGRMDGGTKDHVVNMMLSIIRENHIAYKRRSKYILEFPMPVGAHIEFI